MNYPEIPGSCAFDQFAIAEKVIGEAIAYRLRAQGLQEVLGLVLSLFRFVRHVGYPSSPYSSPSLA